MSRKAKRIEKFDKLIIRSEEVLKLLERHQDLIEKLFRFTEGGAIIFKLKLDHDRSILAYVLAKALLYGLKVSDEYDVSEEEFKRSPSVNPHMLSKALEKFSHESERLLLVTDRGYCLNPDKDKVLSVIELIKDYLIVSGQLE